MAAVTENQTANLDVNHPSMEVVQFTTAASGDTYDSKRFRHIDNAWACQSTTDGVDIQVSWVQGTSTSSPRITLTLESGTVVTGYLVIEGRL